MLQGAVHRALLSLQPSLATAPLSIAVSPRRAAREYLHRQVGERVLSSDVDPSHLAGSQVALAVPAVYTGRWAAAQKTRSGWLAALQEIAPDLPTRSTKEIMQPCLIYLQVISLDLTDYRWRP